MLGAPNPDGRTNRDVVRPWVNGLDITSRPSRTWIIDFGVGMSEQDAALYEAPFEYVLRHVRPQRDRAGIGSEVWWLHWRPRPEMRAALRGYRRYIATPILTKHRLFVWLDADILADHQLVAIARADAYTFGVLHSRVHELWARGTGTQLREVESGFRYTPTTTFETFPFPRPTGRATRGDRRNRTPARRAPRRLAEPARPLGRRTREADPHEPLQRAPDLARPDPRCPRSRRPRRLWLGPPDLPDHELLARLLEPNLAREPA